MDVKYYKPKKKKEIKQGDAIPFLVGVGTFFATLGGFLSFFISGILIGVKGLFGIKEKVRDFQSKYEKTLDLS